MIGGWKRKLAVWTINGCHVFVDAVVSQAQASLETGLTVFVFDYDAVDELCSALVFFIAVLF